jgi:hypothetical protein
MSPFKNENDMKSGNVIVPSEVKCRTKLTTTGRSLGPRYVGVVTGNKDLVYRIREWSKLMDLQSPLPSSSSKLGSILVKRPRMSWLEKQLLLP